MENGQLNDEEAAKSLALATAYEGFYVERAKSLAALATIRQVNIDVLAEQFNLSSPAPNA